MDLTRSVTPAPAVSPESPTSSQAPASAGSNQALLASLGLGGGAASMPVDSLAALLPTLGPVGAVVLDALPVSTAVQLALTMPTVPWVSEWLGEADDLSGRSATATAAGALTGAGGANAQATAAGANAAAVAGAGAAGANAAAVAGTQSAVGAGAVVGASASNAGAGAGGPTGHGAAALAAALVPQPPAPTLPGPFKDLPQTQAEALARHVTDEAIVARVMASARSIVADPNAGESRPAMLKNSVEWIDEGLAKLRVLSLTHDGPLRGGGAGMLAWFDTDAMFGTPSTYDASVDASGTPTNNRGILMQFAGVSGTMGDDEVLTLYAPTVWSEAVLVETIIHEVQHDADQTSGAWSRGQGPARSTDTAASSAYFEAYRSEFNAYWLENPEGSNADNFEPSAPTVENFEVSAKTPTGVQTVLTDFDDARQASIFTHLMGATPPGADWGTHPDWNTVYGYVPYFYVVDPGFKGMVDALDAVTSGNQVNSPRIQALWDAFAAHDPDAVSLAAAELDALDEATLGAPGSAGDFWRFAKKEMPAEAVAVRANLSNPQGGDEPCDGAVDASTPGTVEVQAGDTLLSLADRYLGDRQRVIELAELNGLALDTLDEVLTPGQRLRIPPQ